MFIVTLRQPPRSTLTYTLFPCTPRFRSGPGVVWLGSASVVVVVVAAAFGAAARVKRGAELTSSPSPCSSSIQASSPASVICTVGNSTSPGVGGRTSTTGKTPSWPSGTEPPVHDTTPSASSTELVQPGTSGTSTTDAPSGSFTSRPVVAVPSLPWWKLKVTVVVAPARSEEHTSELQSLMLYPY